MIIHMFCAVGVFPSHLSSADSLPEITGTAFYIQGAEIILLLQTRVGLRYIFHRTAAFLILDWAINLYHGSSTDLLHSLG